MPTIERMKELLEKAGFTVGARNPHLNTAFKGCFMVVEPYDESELPTEDGRNGPWCIVGDNLDALIVEAYNNATPFDAPE